MALTGSAGAVLSWIGGDAVTEAQSEESVERAYAEAGRRGRADVARSARSVSETLRRARRAAQAVADELARAEAAPGAGPLRPPEEGQDAAHGFEPLGETGLLRLSLRADDVYAVARHAHPAPEDLAYLARVLERLAPALRSQLDRAGGVERISAWVEGRGLIGAPAAADADLTRMPLLRPGFGPEVLNGRPDAPGWHVGSNRPGAPASLAWSVQALRDGLPVGSAGAEVSLERMEDLLAQPAEDGTPRCRMLLTSRGEVLSAGRGAAARLGLPEALDGNLPALTEGLRPLTGGEGFFYPSAPFASRRAGTLFFASAVPEADLTVALLLPEADVRAAAAEADSAVARAARDLGHVLMLFGVLAGGVVALAAASFAEQWHRRLSPVLEAASAQAAGDLSRVVPIGSDDEFGVMAVALNTTAMRLRQTLARLEESERRLTGLIETMADGFLIADAEDRITYTNQRFAELLKRPQPSLLGRYVEELLLPESVERYRGESRKRDEGRPSQYEVSWRVYGGQHPRTIVSGMPLFDAEGRYCGSYGLITDITDRHRAQEETARAEKLRALGEMAGGVAHDFNNVLTVILGNTQYMLLDPRDEETLASLKVVERAALDGTETVRRIREFTKTRTLPINADPVDPNRVLAEVMDMAKHRYSVAAKASGIDYEVVVHRRAHRMIRGSAAELREALLNVVNNALEAMPKGGTLTVESFDRGEDSVGLRIDDTGEGMDEETQKKIFDPFFTTKATGRCSGLGLSITYGILRAHSGRIDVRSARGKGTTFTLVLPAHVVSPDDPPAEAAPAEGQPGQPRVLLVSGDERSATALQHGLRELGLYVASVMSPASAHAIVSDPGIFNTLIVEYALEGASGWELARQARASREDLRILLLTDAGHVVDETQARNAGIDRVLVRPFDARDVHGAIFTLLAAPRSGRDSARPAASPTAPQRPRPNPLRSDARREEHQLSTSEVWGPSGAID